MVELSAHSPQTELVVRDYSVVEAMDFLNISTRSNRHVLLQQVSLACMQLV